MVSTFCARLRCYWLVWTVLLIEVGQILNLSRHAACACVGTFCLSCVVRKVPGSRSCDMPLLHALAESPQPIRPIALPWPWGRTAWAGKSSPDIGSCSYNFYAWPPCMMHVAGRNHMCSAIQPAEGCAATAVPKMTGVMGSLLPATATRHSATASCRCT